MFDLHFHSNHSDGLFSVQQLSKIIEKKGINLCSLTDHDTVDGVDALREELKGANTTVLPGVELTVLFRDFEIHVLAYDFDTTEVKQILKEREDIVNSLKQQELKNAVDLFTAQGFIIDESLNVEENVPVGLTVARAVYYNPKNDSLLLSNKGVKISASDFFQKYQAPGAVCSTKRSGVNIDWIIERFKNRVSELIIAHPFISVSHFIKPLSEEDILELVGKGITGVEIFHPKHTQKDILILQELVKNNNLSFTGGSDFHGKDNDIGMGLSTDKYSFFLKNCKL